jgi:hypothetical protein
MADDLIVVGDVEAVAEVENLRTLRPEVCVAVICTMPGSSEPFYVGLQIRDLEEVI